MQKTQTSFKIATYHWTLSTKSAISTVFQFRFEVLVYLKKDVKKRYFILTNETKNLQQNL